MSEVNGPVETGDRLEAADLPKPRLRPRRRGRPAAIWIVPIVAIAAAVALGVRTYLNAGPTIEVTFENADGLEAGKTEVRYKSVHVGKVEKLELSDDRKRVVATVKLTRNAARLAVTGAKFWVERPRIGASGVSGLGTLLSGAYIGVDVGPSTESADEFVGLEKPPGVTTDMHGSRFRLRARDAGSLAVHAPIYLRRVNVGQVSDLHLAADARSVEAEVFIEAPYDRNVTDNTVFWNASGIDLALDASGLRVDTQSLATVIAGGIAFDFRDPSAPSKPARENTAFELYDDRASAMTPPDGVRLIAHLRFHEPMRGVGTGTALDFGGVQLGRVDAVRPGYDPDTREFFADVTASVYPERLGAAYTGLIAEGARTGKSGPQMLQALVGRGLRGQIRSGNLLTGQAYIALAWFPRAPRVAIVENSAVWVIPTEHGGVDSMQEQLQGILRKIDRIPFEAIGEDVHGATRAATALLGHLDRDVVPDAAKMFAQAQLAMAALRDGLTALRDNVAAPDSPIQQSTRATLEQLERAAYSLRSLSDYIEHHPESLLRGRASGPEPKGTR